MEFAQAAKPRWGLKAIHGAEVDVVDEPVGPHRREAPPPSRHVTLLVRDERGLAQPVPPAHARTRASVRAPDGGPIIDSPRVTLADPRAPCGGARLPEWLRTRRRPRQSRRCARLLRPRSGATPFRVELQRPFQRHDRALNRGLAALAKRLGVPCVATGNVHAHTRERARLQDAFVAIREHSSLDASEPLRRGNHAHVMASPAAMAARFADHPDAVEETEWLAESMEFDLPLRPRGPLPGGGGPRGPTARLAEICPAPSSRSAIGRGIARARPPAGSCGRRPASGWRPSCT